MTNGKKLFVTVTGLCLLLCLNTCKMGMGLGPFIDTQVPKITILDPVQNQSLGSRYVTDPIELSGICSDNIGVTALAVEITDVRTGKVYVADADTFTYTLHNDRTWSAAVKTPDIGTSGEAEFSIKVFAIDAFGNKGAHAVIVRIDVIAPWIEKAWIDRHPGYDGVIRFTQDTLYPQSHYDNLINFGDSNAFRTITKTHIDEFQNESFTLKLQLGASFTGVAASRLFMYDAQHNQLNTEELGIIPSRGENVREPEWDFTAEYLASLNPDFAIGPHYIYFEVWAWNNAEWDGSWDTGAPKDADDDTALRKRIIGGTCWYPESDMPHFEIRGDDNTGIYKMDLDSAIEVEIYDDDSLQAVYAALVTNDDFENLRDTLNEIEFHELVRTDAAVREAFITNYCGANLFSAGESLGDRENTITIRPSAIGGYRLLVLAKDKGISDGSNAVWGINSPLRVYALNPNAATIVVERPATENSFPTLTDGSKFTLSGYTIDKQGTALAQIAWIPFDSGLDIEHAIAALNSTLYSADYPYNNDGAAHIVDNIHIWKIPVAEKTVMTLNNNEYYQNNFEKEFDILNDFKVNGVTENKYKVLVLQTLNEVNVTTNKTFRLTSYTEAPTLDILYPLRDNFSHDKDSDLCLRMKVIEKSVGLKDISITDITAGENFDTYLSPLTIVNGEYTRIVTQPNPIYFAEGARRKIRFAASDILGNTISREWEIVMTTLPTLVYVTSSNSAGTYGTGTELRFEAVFTLPVKVIGSPRLPLYFQDPGDDSPDITENVNGLYADRVASPEGNTVYFSCFVPSGLLAPNGLFTPLDPIHFPTGSSIETTEMGGGLAKTVLTAAGNGLPARKKICIDSVRPKVVRASFTQTPDAQGGNSYFNKGKTVTLELETDRQVLVSGSPIARISYSGGASGNVQAAFAAVTHTGNTSTLSFSYTVADTLDIPMSRLKWGSIIQTSGAQAMTASTGDSITDMLGNLLDVSTTLAENDLNGESAGKRAFIVTVPPAAPLIKLTTDSGGVNVLTGGKHNAAIYLTIPVTPYTRQFYSENGSIMTEAAVNVITLADKDAANRNKITYIPTTYQVTAYLEDYAGNRSPHAAAQTVVINSRAPELTSIYSNPLTGIYAYNKDLSFSLNFSRQVQVKAGAVVELHLEGTKVSADPAAVNNTVITMPAAAADRTFSPMVGGINWNVPAGLSMTDIKAKKVLFSGIYDEYGNALKSYDGAAAEDNSRRPITDTSVFNTIPDGDGGLRIESVRPKILQYSPDKPASGELGNGGLMAASNQITLSFDKKIKANAGKTIIVRPYGNWAVPPVLDVQQFDDLYNANFYNNKTDPYSTSTAGIDRTEYQRRLKWINDIGLPEMPTGFTIKGGSYTLPEITDILTARNKYNYYTFTTRGLKQSVEDSYTLVRPDTQECWVLAFRHDLYDGVDELREVFNAAQWDWQIIGSGSGSVAAVDNVITITLPAPLKRGRIWEVLIEEDAFSDEAGNPSAAIMTGEYRFWSSGTETPRIRVDRYSHGDHFHGVIDEASNMYWDLHVPNIDTLVRIDCETPGASIYYDTVRTHFVPAAAHYPSGASEVFTTTTLNTGTSFFDHPNINNAATYPVYDGFAYNAKPPYPAYPFYQYSNEGYANNWIGNGGSHDTAGFYGFGAGGTAETAPGGGNRDVGTAPKPIPRITGFFAGLLVPNVINGTTTHTLVTGGSYGINGAVGWSQLPATASTLYKTTNADGSVSAGPNVFTAETTQTGRMYDTASAGESSVSAGYFVYVGDAKGLSGMNARAASGVTDPRLFSGRRDYITASAQKDSVTTGPTAGPAIAASSLDHEGLYKTTVIHRNPHNAAGTGNGTVNRLSARGFDTPIKASLAGFPLNDIDVGFPVAFDNERMNYYQKLFYRLTGQYNFIWVSWDIVCDWYQGAVALRSGGSNHSVNRGNYNHEMILSTYGAVSYRYQQRFFMTNNIPGVIYDPIYEASHAPGLSWDGNGTR